MGPTAISGLQACGGDGHGLGVGSWARTHGFPELSLRIHRDLGSQELSTATASKGLTMKGVQGAVLHRHLYPSSLVEN